MDTKKWIAETGITTLAHGHHSAEPGRSQDDRGMDIFIDELLVGTKAGMAY